MSSSSGLWRLPTVSARPELRAHAMSTRGRPARSCARTRCPLEGARRPCSWRPGVLGWERLWKPWHPSTDPR